MVDILLITAEDIKENAPISASIDVQLLEPFLPLAQTFHLKPVLGTTLYNELIDAVSGDTLSGANYTLLVNYIQPMLTWYAYLEALPFIWSKTSARGLTKDFSDTSQALDRKELEMMKQEILDKAVTFKNLMIDYLEDNQTTFTSYASEGRSVKSNSTGIYLGRSTRTYNPRTGECCD